MVKIKICGITRKEDALLAAELGADLIGFNFWRPGKRYLEPERAEAIARELPPSLARVGVFVDEPVESMLAIARSCGLDLIQLHGDEPPEVLTRLAGFQTIRALCIRQESDLAAIEAHGADYYLLDARVEGLPGGTGQVVDWDLARQAARRAEIFLAGGLTPENVAQAIETVQPYGVDVASGGESAPGVKDAERLREFIRAARRPP